MVKICGHYPLINGEKTIFRRYTVRSFGFTEQEGKEKYTAYNFAWKFYHEFSQTHLETIWKVSPQLIDPKMESLTSTASNETESELNLREMVASTSSQGAVEFKKPKLTAKAML